VNHGVGVACTIKHHINITPTKTPDMLQKGKQFLLHSCYPIFTNPMISHEWGKVEIVMHQEYLERGWLLTRVYSA
jgi:hypothetical protein